MPTLAYPHLNPIHSPGPTVRSDSAWIRLYARRSRDARQQRAAHIAPVPQRDPVDPTLALKRQLVAEIVAIIDGFSQWEIGVYLRIDQPRVSDLKRGKLERFTIDRLIRLLSRLDHDVALDIRHRSGSGLFARRGRPHC